MSNFIFSRRSLQQRIAVLAKVLDCDQLTSLVDRMNNHDRLAAMWECVWLHALSVGNALQHEALLQSGKRPDFELSLTEAVGRKTLVGDITSVSDAGLDEQNPVETLSGELVRLARKHELEANHFSYRAEGNRVGSFGNARMNLTLPPRGKLLVIFKEEVEPWVKNLASMKPEIDSFSYARGGIEFSLTYNVRQQFMGGSHLSYEVALSKTKNPLFKALKAKADQLRAAPDDAIRMVIVCDGDSDLLRKSPLMYSPGAFQPSEVAQDFLRQTNSIDFVLLATVSESRGLMGHQVKYRNQLTLVAAQPRFATHRITDEVAREIENLVNQAATHLPSPMRTPYNSARLCRTHEFGPDMIGGYEMSGNNFKISVRAFQRLLAGEITSDAFLEAHDWKDGHNPFRRMNSEGRLVQTVTVEDCGDKDDDWLCFSFGAPDPAAAPFRIPDNDSSN